MQPLSSSLRRQLEVAILAARRAAESASRAALDGLGVFADRRPEHLDDERVALRNGLRAKWRQLGGDKELLVAECAYEQWHRLLFARFLAENGLLIHPKFRAPVSIADCEDLAGEFGEPDGWSLAARFAAEILPGIFRLADPCVRLRLAPEGRDSLERLLSTLAAEIFLAADALGWVYQFWQRDEKDAVNASQRRIDGADLAPVTQLFTENYMVRFLLENSLGAWWASRHPDSPLNATLAYLARDDAGRPAAGSFSEWPDRVAEITLMDPCCGSGHFLVEALSLLWQMRAEEEGLTMVEAQDAVLLDNLYGLELDPRCVQIAMFGIALQAWKTTGQWRQLPIPNIACSGIPVKATVEDWKVLANGDTRLENALARLHVLFRHADTLGSLIDPRSAAEWSDSAKSQRSFEDVNWEEVVPLLLRAADAERADPAMAVLGASAAGIARAADYLSRTYTLIATNVPYLARRHQGPILEEYLQRRHKAAAANLATAALDRFSLLSAHGGATASVSPQNWLFASSYRSFRRTALANQTWRILARLGVGAFAGISGEVVDVHLLITSATKPSNGHVIRGLDVTHVKGVATKDEGLRSQPLLQASQRDLLEDPEARVSFGPVVPGSRLEAYATARQGLATADDPMYKRFFWESSDIPSGWVRHQTSVRATQYYGGCDGLVNIGELQKNPPAGSALRGLDVWGRPGISVRQTRPFPCALYMGVAFDMNASVIVPHRVDDLPAIWHYCTSDKYASDLHEVDQSLKVTNSNLVKVPFDIDIWRRVAEETGPLPTPSSQDPTQWLFRGRPENSTAVLQVAVARLLGFRWPEQAKNDELDALADSDGIVCLPSVAGEQPAVERLQRMLMTAYGASWAPERIGELLAQTGSKRALADWLRDEFFKQHCSMFGNRPFIWHVWDGQPDGFSVLINYHRCDRKLIEKLTYSYLGQDWVERQRAGVRDEVPGAQSRLTSALKLQGRLEAIISGEPPLDIYVRWKAPNNQPTGWDPDMNDGVRTNIRPFVEAGVLRSTFDIHWKIDRGKNPDGTARRNDVHLSLAEKRAARTTAKPA